MSQQLRQRIFTEIDSVSLIDPHTHINPLAPSSETLADILGYHYYTELAHAAGMPVEEVEAPGIDPKEKVARLVGWLEPLTNTSAYGWLIELAREFFGFEDEHITRDNWEALYDTSAAMMASPDWPKQVLKKSGIDAVFLTNDFDDPLEGFDRRVYIPCLRTDNLVFNLAKPAVRVRLEKASSVNVSDAKTLRTAIGALFDHFTANGARACAVSLPPDFCPQKPESAAKIDRSLAILLSDGESASADAQRSVSQFVFWTLAEFASEYRLPFDLMIGVNREVYPTGVYQGHDLFDSRWSLLQYRELLNTFTQVTFPISVLASTANQELVAHAWMFPNVVTNGHWWYSNMPTFIERDAAARLEAVPRTKQIGYYSDAYKLEFALPKFAMYKRILAKILAERFVVDARWSEESAVLLGRQILRENVERVFSCG